MMRSQGDVPPGHRRMAPCGLLGEARGGLTDDLEESFGGTAEDRVRVEGRSTSIDDAGQLVGCVEEISQPLVVGATHKGMASARMCSSRGLSPTIDTTSTGFPRSS